VLAVRVGGSAVLVSEGTIAVTMAGDQRRPEAARVA
jgi:hypothetical protein